MSATLKNQGLSQNAFAEQIDHFQSSAAAGFTKTSKKRNTQERVEQNPSFLALIWTRKSGNDQFFSHPYCSGSLQETSGYEDSSQNALWKYMHEYFVRRYTALAKEKLGVDTLDTQLAYSIRFYCMISVGVTQEWVLNDNITSAETVVRMMFASMPENMQAAVFGQF